MATEGEVYNEVNETCLDWMGQNAPELHEHDASYTYSQIADLANTINRRIKPLIAALQAEHDGGEGQS